MRCQRLESLFLPDAVDLSWFFEEGVKHVNLLVNSAWMQQYLSNQDPIYEDQKNRAVCKSINLAPLSRAYPIQLKESFGYAPDTIEHREVQHNENSTHGFQTLLSSLTRLDLLVAFSAAVSTGVFGKKQPADILCFRKPDHKTSRVAIRWKETRGATTSWTTAALRKILVPKDKLLKLELTSRQDGNLLNLDGVVAVDGKGDRLAKKPEKLDVQYVEDVPTIPPGIPSGEPSLGDL